MRRKSHDMKLIMESWRGFINEENFNSLEKLKAGLGDNYSPDAVGGTTGYANEEELQGIAPFVTNDNQLKMVVRQIKKRSGKAMLDFLKKRASSDKKATQAGGRKPRFVAGKNFELQALNLLGDPKRKEELKAFMKKHSSEFSEDFKAAIKNRNFKRAKDLAAKAVKR